ncbi:hypothetical protein cypCar_00044825 [Cyprinus carpio]|nr:hypothetical protein cypCar_00044825 [Cyprinus carpio]
MISNAAVYCLCMFLTKCVSGVYSDETVISVMEGDSVTLNTDVTELQRDDQILWTFRLNSSENRIAEIYKQIVSIYDNKENNERFRDRLKIDEQTGSLTITNINKLHSGLYKLQIINGGVKHKSFSIAVYGVFGDTDVMKSVSVTEGDSVTLNTDVTEVQRDDHILWMFGPKETRIAEIYKHIIDMFSSNEIFGDRLQMDSFTGSLIIRNIRRTDSGLYKLQIGSNRGSSDKTFSVTVYVNQDGI